MTSKQGNIFAALAMDEEGETTVPQQQVKKQQPEKKQEVRPKTAKEQQPRKPQGIDAQPEGFESVGTQQRTQGRGERGGYRGGRGGRGGRGERREGQGERRECGRFQEGQEGEYVPRGRGGYRGERGRGFGGRGRAQYRPKSAVEGEQPLVEGGDEGTLIAERKERVDWKGKDEGYKGKPRETWHPYDRRSGTGRGRGLAKGGHGKGNWGDVKDEIQGQTAEPEGGAVATEAVPKEGEEGEKKTEGVEGVKEEASPVKSPVVEEEEENAKEITLEEYMASKKKATFKKEARKPEELKKANIEKAEPAKNKVETINTSIKGQETYNVAVGKSEHSGLLGFQGGEDEMEGGYRGRGGRGQRRGMRTGGARGGQQRGGGRMQMPQSEEAFPSL